MKNPNDSTPVCTKLSGITRITFSSASVANPKAIEAFTRTIISPSFFAFTRNDTGFPTFGGTLTDLV
uniref:Uncharacterized protein n=1 Tax=Anopheles quadriannulatus TaxID=34691 RepID=A0A182XRR5_ANOQN